MAGFVAGGMAFGALFLLVVGLAYARIREQRKLSYVAEELKLSHESLADKITVLENMVAEFGGKSEAVPKQRGPMALALDSHDVQYFFKALHEDYCNLFIRNPGVDWLIRDVVFNSNARVVVFADCATWAVEIRRPIVGERYCAREEARWGAQDDAWELAALR